jgi:hypothetical protein
MYLLYLDESGNENDPSDRFFVLAGLALFERQTYHLTQAVDEVQRKHFPGHQPIAFHASEIRSGRKLWRSVTVEKRQEIFSDLLAAIQQAPERGRHLFAAVIEKSDQLYGEAAVERATEELCRRFDILLQRQYHNAQDPQRGLLVFSEGRFDARARIWVRGFHQRGTSWGAINNLADIPYFASPSESRLLQLADLIAHAIWLLYEKRDGFLAQPLIPLFDAQEGKLHGLVHVRKGESPEPCECPACFSRRAPGQFGPWMR